MVTIYENFMQAGVGGGYCLPVFGKLVNAIPTGAWGTDYPHYIITGPSRSLNGVVSLNYAFALTFDLMRFQSLLSKTQLVFFNRGELNNGTQYKLIFIIRCIFDVR